MVCRGIKCPIFHCRKRKCTKYSRREGLKGVDRDAVSFGKWVPEFWRSLLSLSKGYSFYVCLRFSYMGRVA